MLKTFDSYEKILEHLMYDDENLEKIIEFEWYDDKNIKHIFIMMREQGCEDIVDTIFMAEIIMINNIFIIIEDTYRYVNNNS